MNVTKKFYDPPNNFYSENKFYFFEMAQQHVFLRIRKMARFNSGNIVYDPDTFIIHVRCLGYVIEPKKKFYSDFLIFGEFCKNFGSTLFRIFFDSKLIFSVNFGPILISVGENFANGSGKTYGKFDFKIP